MFNFSNCKIFTGSQTQPRPSNLSLNSCFRVLLSCKVRERKYLLRNDPVEPSVFKNISYLGIALCTNVDFDWVRSQWFSYSSLLIGVPYCPGLFSFYKRMILENGRCLLYLTWIFQGEQNYVSFNKQRLVLGPTVEASDKLVVHDLCVYWY